MALKNVQLFLLTADTTPEDAYTAAATTRAVATFFSCQNPNASAVIVRVSKGNDAAGTRIFEESIPANKTKIFYPRWVLAPGEKWQLSSTSADDTVVCLCTGTEDAP
jgi:hypothetical protein